MKLHLYAGYLTDAPRFNQWCIARRTTDPVFSQCWKDSCMLNDVAVEIYAKRMKFSWRKKISIDYLPCPKDKLGAVDETRRNTIFSFRDYDFTGPLIKFSSWPRYQETDTDREYKTHIEDLLGFELGPWTIVSYVGHQGLFYDFSPETIRIIYDLMKDKVQKRKERDEAIQANAEESNKTGGAIVSVPGPAQP
ncbi:unnamed protein product [Rhizoctonia solani]|uniref:Uncharacterized protein n=1 Tax=Rhizoctonia solani TaxID=456999 RepID=A0A8H3B3U8_9AGAM|nr:unnamed protein product [Rhizoctonia solani]